MQNVSIHRDANMHHSLRIRRKLPCQCTGQHLLRHYERLVPMTLTPMAGKRDDSASMKHDALSRRTPPESALAASVAPAKANRLEPT